jgi:prepilin-type N-terminal cleavage/methylation domain-containing protein
MIWDTHNPSGEPLEQPASGGFSLPEVMMAVAILSLFVLANFSILSFSRIQTVKDHERGIMLDFASHYLELVKGLPFDEIKSGAPINALYDGASGGTLIAFPTSTNWLTIDNVNFQSFHPDLIWLSPRNPQMSVFLDTRTIAGIPHDKHIQLLLQWDAPMNLGSKQTLRMDMVRVKDL